MLDFLRNRLRRSDRTRYAETIGSQSDCASLYSGIIVSSPAYVPVCSGREILDGQPFDGINTKLVDSRGREIVTTSGSPFVVEYLAALDPILSSLRADAVIASSQPPGLDQTQQAAAIWSWL
jgi:hypothetical protein